MKQEHGSQEIQQTQQQQQQLNQQLQSSQLIPKLWRPKSSKDIIHEFFAEHLKIPLAVNDSLEIELRLGRCELTKRKKGSDPNVYAKVLRDLSIQTPLIVGSNHPRIQNKLKMLSSTSLSEVKHVFNPQISESLFMSRLEYISKNNQHSGRRLDFSIDFIPENRDRNVDIGRFTMDIENGTFQNLIKKNKMNLDFIHQGLDFRISGSVEETHNLTREEFQRKIGLCKVTYARVKIRQTFRFQFLEFSFTRVYELKVQNQPLINQLQLIFKKDTPQTSEQMKSQALFTMIQAGVEPIHEIEVELVDVAFLKNLMDSDYFGFTRIVDRYLRNAEILYSWPDEFANAGYRQNFDKDKIEFPMLGGYLETISHKRLDLKKKNQAGGAEVNGVSLD